MTLKKIRELAKVLQENNLQEISYEDKEFKVTITKGKDIEEKKSEENDYQKSPLVGTFFHANPPIKIGERVKKGQVICIINSMKIMNEICAPYDGIIKDIKKYDKKNLNC